MASTLQGKYEAANDSELRNSESNMKNLVQGKWMVDGRAQKILLGEEMLPKLEGISKESYKSVKRFSSLLPSEIVNRIFESKLEIILSHESINGDRYWTQSSNEVIPNAKELVETVSQYEEFYNSGLGQQFSGFIDHTMKQGQRVRLQNFAVTNN